MAEQSMFWPTTGTGDGISGGYTSDRLASIWKAVIGNGVLKYLNDLEVAGTGTTSLTINTGAAVVNGYLYENTTSATIATSTLGSATYGLYIIANESSSALTVSRSVAGTSVAAKAVRLALNSTAPAQPYIKIATVTTAAGSITSISVENDRWAESRTTNYSNIAYAYAESPFTALNNTETTVIPTSYTDSDFIQVDTGTGVFTVKQRGTYIIQTDVVWDTNTTNRRRITVAGGVTQLLASSFIHTTSQRQKAYEVIEFLTGNTFTIDVWQDSGATRTISSSQIYIVRL